MKTIIRIIFITILFASVSTTYSQGKVKPVKTVEFGVSGACNMCKERIKNATLIKGVKFAEWNKETKILKVVLNINKTTVDNIHNAVAKAGHDTEKVKAPDEVYNNLPACCAYRDGVEVH